MWGPWIRRLRLARGLSSLELRKRPGLRSLEVVEQMHRTVPSMELVYGLSHAYQVPLMFLYRALLLGVDWSGVEDWPELSMLALEPAPALDYDPRCRHQALIATTKALRVEQGLSVAALRPRIGSVRLLRYVDGGTARSIEGKTLRLASLVKVANALEVPVVQLLAVAWPHADLRGVHPAFRPASDGV